ncbi:41902_t:CDS:2, partial [Gigaspora margarita]
IAHAIKKYIRIGYDFTKETNIEEAIQNLSRTFVACSATDYLSHIITPSTTHSIEEIRNNASAQKKSAKLKEIIKKNLKKLENIYNITTDSQLHKDLLTRILDQKKQMVVRYDIPSRSSFLTQNSYLLKYIYESNIYGSNDLEQLLFELLLKTIATKEYYHSAWVSVTRVSYDEPKEYLDKHYCLAFVKGAKQFAQTFSDVSIIISQDDKSKIVQVPDYDFVCGSNQKLIPLVYLMIKPSEINDDL